MNIILFENDENLTLEKSDCRFEHIKNVLKTKNGEKVFAGIVNAGMAMYEVSYSQDNNSCTLKLSEELKPVEKLNINLCVAFTRPQIAQRILFESACFGIKSLTFYAAEKSELSYLKSSLYSDKNILTAFIKGASQACATHIPEFSMKENLEDAISSLKNDSSINIATDIYQASQNIADVNKSQNFNVILGGERGFSQNDRKLLIKHNYKLTKLSEKILRTDTAVITTLAFLENKIK